MQSTHRNAAHEAISLISDSDSDSCRIESSKPSHFDDTIRKASESPKRKANDTIDTRLSKRDNLSLSQYGSHSVNQSEVIPLSSETESEDDSWMKQFKERQNDQSSKMTLNRNRASLSPSRTPSPMPSLIDCQSGDSDMDTDDEVVMLPRSAKQVSCLPVRKRANVYGYAVMSTDSEEEEIVKVSVPSKQASAVFVHEQENHYGSSSETEENEAVLLFQKQTDRPIVQASKVTSRKDNGSTFAPLFPKETVIRVDDASESEEEEIIKLSVPVSKPKAKRAAKDKKSHKKKISATASNGSNIASSSNSGSEHTPGVFNPKSQSVEEQLEIMEAGIHTDARGRESLQRIVKQPLNPNIFAWRNIERTRYTQSYTSISSKFQFAVYIDYLVELWKLQIYYFAFLLKNNVYTIEQLKDQTRPYFTKLGFHEVMNRAVIHFKDKKITSRRLNPGLSVEQCLTRFVRYCGDVSLKEAEKAARRAHLLDVDECIDTIKNWNSACGHVSPFVESVAPMLPHLDVPFVRDGENSKAEKTFKNVKPGEMTTRLEMTMQILGVRPQLHAAVVHRKTVVEQNALLATYGRNRMEEIAAAFCSLAAKSLTIFMIRYLSRHELFNVIRTFLLIPLNEGVSSIKAEVMLGKVRWNEMQSMVKSNIDYLRENYEDGEPKHTYHIIPVCIRSFFTRRVNQTVYGSKLGKAVIGSPKVELNDHLCDTYEMTGRKCSMCSVLLTLLNKCFNTASIDRIIPGRRGGKYKIGNVQLLCIGCQMEKFWYKLEEALALLYVLAIAQWTQTNGLLDTKLPQDRKEMTKREAKVVLTWIRAKRLNIQLNAEKTADTGRKTKPLEMTEVQMLDRFKQHWIGNGWTQDIAGVRAPFSLMSFDRINSDGPYSVENTRLLFIGLNLLKSDNKDDTKLIAYLSYLKTQSKRLDELVTVKTLPLEKHIARLLADDPEAVKEQEKIIAREEEFCAELEGVTALDDVQIPDDEEDAN